MSCNIFLRISIVGAIILLLAVACSSSDDSGSVTSISAAETVTTTVVPAPTNTTTSAPSGNVEEETSLVVPFTAANGGGTVEVSGVGSPVVAWFGGLPGEVSLDLADADVNDAASVVEELVSFWFFQDDDSGDVPPNVYVSASGDISDSVGSRYVVEAQGLPPAPVAETTTTTSSTSTTSTSTSSVPETSEPPSAATSSTTTSTSTTTTTTTTVVESPAILQVQVLNGSGVAGAAGRMTDKLSEAGYVVLSPENAPQRYSSSAVYFAEGWQDEAEEILQAAEIDEIDAPTVMPQIFASEDASVIVLLGTDTAPVVAREQAWLRPRPNFDVKLPLGSDVPRDRFVPGLADIQIYTRQNDEDPTTFNYIDSLQRWLRYVADFREDNVISSLPEDRGTYENLLAVYDSIEEVFDWLGFTPQNTCGAPAGYSFTDLLQPTREFSEETQSHRGNAIFTTERLLELHGGTRINPEANPDFYIQQAVQTAYDALRVSELLDETEVPQLILCRAFLAPSGEIPEYASTMWYALLTPGIQPRESLLSQGTYHVKEISRNGNLVHIIVCHPTIRERHILLHWRETGYRAEILGYSTHTGCQGTFDGETSISEDSNGAEDTFRFGFGERVFSAGDLLGFPRS